ncbi:C3a anaphylatoxin chemotactic receptor-like isoform X2 [Paramormyrops kingsleyae]|uniref:C3a anaphylatoxin chemotactic receptor isoform X2 n=1 Tax=Paramormyrops kingsleyae TaxID=1676925 RepID=UPI003B975B0B
MFSVYSASCGLQDQTDERFTSHFHFVAKQSHSSLQRESLTSAMSEEMLNLSVDYYYEEDFAPDPGFQMMNIIVTVFYAITCVLGIPGNAFVMWIAGMKMKKTVNTTWFLNLAIADLLCCLSIPFIITEVLLNYHWPFGKILCKMIPSVIVLNMFASIVTLTLISMDRFLQVIKPVWSQNHRTVTLASQLCALSWLLSMLLCLPNMIYRETAHFHYSNQTRCMISDHSVRKMACMSRFVLGFLIPIVIIVLCNSFILRKVNSGRFSTSQKPRQIIVGVIMAFCLCWLPYHVVGTMLEYGGKTSEVVAMYLDQPSIVLAYLNSCLNPLLYAFIGQDFKKKVRVSLKRAFQNAFNDTSVRSSTYSKTELPHTSNSAETCIS